MIILGLDVATETGWAVSTGRKSDDVTSGIIKLPKVSVAERAYILSQEVIRIIKLHGVPDYAMIEAPLGASPNPKTLAELNRLSGSALGALAGYGCRCNEVAVSTWRNAMYGFGRQKGWQTKDWKAHAIKHCGYLGLQVENDNEAEAILISQYGLVEWTRIQQLGDQQPVKKPKQTRQKQHALEGI